MAINVGSAASRLLGRARARTPAPSVGGLVVLGNVGDIPEVFRNKRAQAQFQLAWLMMDQFDRAVDQAAASLGKDPADLDEWVYDLDPDSPEGRKYYAARERALDQLVSLGNLSEAGFASKKELITAMSQLVTNFPHTGLEATVDMDGPGQLVRRLKH